MDFALLSVLSCFIIQSRGSLDLLCPHFSQWNQRSKEYCHNPQTKYSCLYDARQNGFKEDCILPEYVGPGFRFFIRVYVRTEFCEKDKYNPFILYTNISSDCMLLKSNCSGEGQVVYDDGKTTKDRSCGCDYIAGFAFSAIPRNKCFCIPSEEDCSCVKKECPMDQALSPDYECIHKTNWTGRFACSETFHADVSSTRKVGDSTNNNPYDTLIIPSRQPEEKYMYTLTTFLAMLFVLIVPLLCLLLRKTEEKGDGEVFLRELKTMRMSCRRPVEIVLNEIRLYEPKNIFCFEGPGASIVMHDVALQLNEDFEYKTILATSPSDILNKHKPNQKEVFVLYNIFGGYVFDPILFDSWNLLCVDIEEMLNTGNVKIMTSSKSNIVNSLPFQIHLFLNASVDLLAPEYALSDVERKNIMQMYLTKEQISLLPIPLEIPHLESFPLFFRLLPVSKNIMTAIKQNIPQLVKSELEKLSKNIISRCILILFVLADNNVSDHMQFPEDKMSFIKFLEQTDYSEGFISSWNNVMEEMKNFNNVLFKKSGNAHMTIHDTIFDILVTYIGSRYCGLVIRYAKPTVIRERFHFDTITQVAEEDFIQIPCDMEILYFQRLCTDIKSGYTECVFTNRMLKFKSFRSKFMKYLKSDTNAIEAVARFASLRDTTKSPLLLCCIQGFPDIVSWLVNEMKYDVKMTDEAGRSPLYLASEYCHRETVKTLLKECHCKLDVCRTDKGHQGESPLFVACSRGYKMIVRLLLGSDADINVCNYMGFSPLYVASSNGNKEIVTLLLDRNAKHNLLDSNGNSPLHKASEKGYSLIAELLLKHAADPNILNAKRQTPLHLATLNGYTETASILLSKESNPYLTDDAKMTPLHIVSKTGNSEIASLLLEKTADINIKSLHDNTPLYIATKENRSNVVKILLEKGADPNIYAFGKITPLYVATQNENPEIARLLLEKGADPNIACSIEDTAPLHLACRKGYKDIVHLFMEFKEKCKFKVNLRDVNHRTPLYTASREGHFNIVKELLQNGTDPDIPTVANRTPLFLASLTGYPDIVETLLKHNADPDVVSVDHETALYCASKEGHIEIVKSLLYYKARVIVEKVQSPLDAANEGGHDKIHQLLEQHQKTEQVIEKI